MPAWLAGVVKLVLDWALAKLTEWVTALVAKFKRHKEIDKEAKDSGVPMKEAKSAEEIDKATDSTLSGL